MNDLRRVSLATALLYSMSTGLSIAQTPPKAPPTGTQREPGLFGGVGGQKKNKKEREEDEATRALAGTVRNEAEELVEGAVVQLKDNKSLKVRSYITKADGVYRFFGLSTNADYEIRAEFRALASEKRTLSVFDSRKQAVINLKVAAVQKKDEKVAKEEASK
jgi:Carboxypeptidase regulatory-like domain